MNFLLIPVNDWVNYVLSAAQLALSSAKIGVEVWFFLGGWKFLFRNIGFWIDTNLVNLIAKVYSYFFKLLEGTMFNEAVVSSIMRNVYVFIGIIMFFRLMMVVIKYVVNPDLISDAKAGANSLIKRCILGMCGILFIPTIFDLGLQLQSSILKDQIVQQIIIPKEMTDVVKRNVTNGGRFIGTYVLSGFVNPNENASKKAKLAYANAIVNGDLSSLNLSDGFLTDRHEYDYFFLISTFCLGYVLYLMIKYCIDIATRFFRLLLYQILAPIAMIEYMINGSDDGVYKNWLKSILGTYFMLFVRVLAIWFVIFVLSLMSEISDLSAGSLLVDNDYLLRALIIIALLGFLMDLPKLIGQIFGLDLEQEGQATGLLKQVGGMVKGAALGVLAVGGAAVGGAIGVGKSAIGALPGGKDANGAKVSLSKKWSDMKQANAEQHPGINSIASATNKAGSGILGAALSSNHYTGAAYKGYQSQRQEQQQAAKESEDMSKALENKRKQKVHEKLESQQLQELQNKAQNSAADVQQIKIDPTSIAAMAGAMNAATNAHMPNNQQQMPNINANQNGQTTVSLDNLDIKVTGKATADYSGDLETNITGKATTNYNGDLETTVNGQARAMYDKGLDVDVQGPARANYDKGLDVDINGPARATYDKGLDVDVSGTATTSYNGDVNTVVGGNATTIVDHNINTVVGEDVNIDAPNIDIRRNNRNQNDNDNSQNN